MNTLIVFFTSRHFVVTSAFFSSMMLRLAGKNLVIGMTAGEGRFRSPLNSSPLIEEGLEENTVQEFLEREEISFSGLRIGIKFTG